MGVSRTVEPKRILQIRNGIGNIVQYFLFEGFILGDGRGKAEEFKSLLLLCSIKKKKKIWHTKETNNDILLIYENSNYGYSTVNFHIPSHVHWKLVRFSLPVASMRSLQIYFALLQSIYRLNEAGIFSSSVDLHPNVTFHIS